MKKTFIFLASALIMLSNSDNADAQQAWDTLPDGRVVIQVFNERLAFDPKDKDIVTNDKPNYAPVQFEIVTPDGLKYMSLKQVIENRSSAEVFFANAAKMHSDGVRLILNFSRDNLLEPRAKTQYEGLYLGKFPYTDIDGNGGARALTFFIIPNSNYEFKQWTGLELPYPYLEVRLGSDQFGITSYVPVDRGEEGVPGKAYNPNTLYVVPAALRSVTTEHDLLIICSYFNSCSFGSTTPDRIVRMEYLYNSERFPRVSWVKLDETIKHLAAYIFIDRTPGEFQ